jgi:hypothetical protein
MSVAEESHDTTYDRGVRATNGFLSKVFVSCAGDPKGSVHRAWGLSLLFAVLFFVLSVVESEFLNEGFLNWFSLC